MRPGEKAPSGIFLFPVKSFWHQDKDVYKNQSYSRASSFRARLQSSENHEWNYSLTYSYVWWNYTVVFLLYDLLKWCSSGVFTREAKVISGLQILENQIYAKFAHEIHGLGLNNSYHVFPCSYKNGKEAMGKSQYEKAVICFSKAITLQPEQVLN